MNIALPALVVFLLLLPGFIFRSRFKRFERVSTDYSPFGRVVTEAILWVMVLHVIWLTGTHILLGRHFDVSVLLGLISSNPTSQATSIAAITDDFKWIAGYFVSLLAASYSIPVVASNAIIKYRLDRINSRFSPYFRFHAAPWHYLLSGADFEKHEQPDFISISAIIDVAGEPVLYTGILDEVFFGEDGQPDRFVLQGVMRRPFTADKSRENQDGHDPFRFYEVDGDYFVLRYSEAITLNVQYIKLADEDGTGLAGDPTGQNFKQRTLDT